MKKPATLAGTLVLLCAGCVDPSSDFKAFGSRIRARDAGAAGAAIDGGGCTVDPGSVDGDYLFALSVSIARGKPILFLTHITTPAVNSGTGVLFDAQALSAADRRTPVGSALSLGPFPLDSRGGFHASLPGLKIAGAANPITNGDIAADVTLSGKLCGDGRFFCGVVAGAATSPLRLDLSGSSFTFTRVGASDAAAPTRPAIDCRGTPADPLTGS